MVRTRCSAKCSVLKPDIPSEGNIKKYAKKFLLITLERRTDKTCKMHACMQPNTL